MKNVFVALVAASALLAITGCGGGDNTAATTTVAPTTTTTVAPTTTAAPTTTTTVAPTTAPPAASPDQAFLASVRGASSEFAPVADSVLIDHATQICSDLASGVGADPASLASDFTANAAERLINASVVAYCPQYLNDVSN